MKTRLQTLALLLPLGLVAACSPAGDLLTAADVAPAASITPVCLDFEGEPLGSTYGTPTHSPGDWAFTEAGVPVTVEKFFWVGGGTTFNYAQIVLPSPSVAWKQAVTTNNINLLFHIYALGGEADRVKFVYVDEGGNENLAVNGDLYVGELDLAPASLGGASVWVWTTPTASGVFGQVEIVGTIKHVMVGGQEFTLDHFCAA